LRCSLFDLAARDENHCDTHHFAAVEKQLPANIQILIFSRRGGQNRAPSLRCLPKASTLPVEETVSSVCRRFVGSCQALNSRPCLILTLLSSARQWELSLEGRTPYSYGVGHNPEIGSSMQRITSCCWHIALGILVLGSCGAGVQDTPGLAHLRPHLISPANRIICVTAGVVLLVLQHEYRKQSRGGE
jgi:hypothetical protein